MDIYWYHRGKRGDSPWSPASAMPNGSRSSALQAYSQGNNVQQSAERKPINRVEQIMKSPVRTLEPSNTLADVRQLFHANGFRHLPILDDKDRLVGILSDRDLLRELAAMSNSLMDWIDTNAQREKKIGQFMQTKILTAQPQASIREAAKAMYTERVGALPIVGPNHELLGIVTRSDILRVLVNEAPLALWG